MSRAEAPDPTHDTEALDPTGFTDFLQRALDEDEVARDVTTAALVTRDHTVTAELRVKQPGVICGLPLAGPLFRLLDPEIELELLAEDGDRIGASFVVLRVRGSAAAILRGERTLLNVMQRLSGVATTTAAFVELTMGTGVGIYDTRKTTPGWRALEKYAVRCGGGRNHRMTLADAAMIKENHLVAAYGHTGPEAVAAGVKACLAALEGGVDLYVEVEDQGELEAAVLAAGDAARDLVIMLDDFEIGALREAVRWVRSLSGPRPRLEVTGGVTLESVDGLASTGVERLSVGSLTHSAPALDMSLKIVAEDPGDA